MGWKRGCDLLLKWTTQSGPNECKDSSAGQLIKTSSKVDNGGESWGSGTRWDEMRIQALVMGLRPAGNKKGTERRMVRRFGQWEDIRAAQQCPNVRAAVKKW
jgi:hypothetical protein